MRKAAFVLVWLFLVVCCQGRVITVDDDGPADFNNIQAAIDDAIDGDEVVVADGIYTGEGNRDINFQGKAITVKSESGPENCIIDCNGTQAEHHCGFYFHSGEDANSVIDGFTITNGRYGPGVGISCHRSSPTVNNCNITGNTGSAIFCEQSNPTVNNCNIDGSRGGAILCRESSLTINNCSITNNRSKVPMGAIQGEDQSRFTITNCSIINNISCGISLENDSSATITNSTVSYSASSEIYCKDSSSIIINNSIVWGDSHVITVQSGHISVRYSDIRGGWPGQGNINADPMLTLDGHLRGGSPCIDASDPNTIYIAGVDIDGEPRITGNRLDMGSDEFFDTDVDGLPDWWESKYFGSRRAAKPNEDPDLDGHTNITEYELYSCDPTVSAITYYVDAVYGDDNNDGLSPETAFATIQKGINASNDSDTVIVVPGTYTGDGNRYISFDGKAIIVRSTEPNDPNIVAETVIDCTDTPNLRGFAFNFDHAEREISIVDGFTISNFLDGIECSGGSPTIDNCVITQNSRGISCSGSSPTIRSCTISESRYSGGIHCIEYSNPKISDCNISSNRSVMGGGIWCYRGSSPTINRCIIRGNSTYRIPFFEPYGGGIYCSEGSAPIIKDCTITGNSAPFGNGGGIACTDQGDPIIINCALIENSEAIFCEDSNPTISNCNLNKNGYGIYFESSSPTIKDCVVSENGTGIYCNNSSFRITNCVISCHSYSGIVCEDSITTIDNCIISGNATGTYHGGGIECRGSILTAIKTTITNNLAYRGGGIYAWEGSTTGIVNCIVWDNTASQGSQIAVGHPDLPWESSLTISFSDVQGGQDEVYSSPNSVLNWGEGNIDADPCFVEMGYWDVNGVWLDGDYHLLDDSPCIDTGDPNYLTEPNETDIDGNPRVIDGDEDGEAVVDMGAYEYRPAVEAEIEIKPEVVNLASRGKWVMCHIRLGEDYDVGEIQAESVMLEYEVQVESVEIDQQRQVAIARFRRAEVEGVLEAGEVEVTVSGELMDGTVFEGRDIIRVIDGGGKKKPGSDVVMVRRRG